MGRTLLPAQERLSRGRVIGGLVERQHPGKRKTGRQVSFSTDLIYDVLRKYEPDHLLLRAAWDDARTRMTELGRLVGWSTARRQPWSMSRSTGSRRWRCR